MSEAWAKDHGLFVDTSHHITPRRKKKKDTPRKKDKLTTPAPSFFGQEPPLSPPAWARSPGAGAGYGENGVPGALPEGPSTTTPAPSFFGQEPPLSPPAWARSPDDDPDDDPDGGGKKRRRY